MTACTRCATALEDGDLRCAICGLVAPPPDARPAGRPWAQVLRCSECGAAVGFSAQAQAPRCGFCAATMAIEQPIDPIEEAERQLPFTVDRAAAQAALRGWLTTRGWLAPRALARLEDRQRGECRADRRVFERFQPEGAHECAAAQLDDLASERLDLADDGIEDPAPVDDIYTEQRHAAWLPRCPRGRGAWG